MPGEDEHATRWREALWGDFSLKGLTFFRGSLCGREQILTCAQGEEARGGVPPAPQGSQGEPCQWSFTSV